MKRQLSETIGKIEAYFKKNVWLTVFLFVMPFLNESFPTNYFIYIMIREDVVKFAALAVLVYLFIRNKKKISLLAKILIALEIMLMISSFINYRTFVPDDYEKMFSDMACTVMMGLVIEYFIDKPRDLINGLHLSFEVAVYSYFIGLMLNIPEDGYYRRGLLATLTLWIVPAVCLALLRMIREKKYIRSCILLTVCFYLTYDIWNATMIVALAGMAFVLICGYLLFRWDKEKKYRIPLSLLFGIAVALNLFVLFVYSGKNFPLVSFIITKVLKKSVNFTQRDVIWDEAIRMIKEKPIFGHGSRPALKVANDFASEYSHSHNQFLQKLNESGVFGLAIFLYFHYELIRKVDHSRNIWERLILIAAVFAIFLTYITEAYKKFFIFYLVLFLAYHCDGLLKKD